MCGESWVKQYFQIFWESEENNENVTGPEMSNRVS